MLNENAKKWVEALRSGKYEQGSGALKRRVDDGEYEFCCLGVACELFGSGIRQRVRDDGCVVYGEDWETGWFFSLPPEVMRALGLSGHMGGFPTSLGTETLAGLNDTGKTFAEIADIIESEPPGLFVETAVRQ